MITVNCPNCAAAYKLDEAKFGPQGRKVKCAKCATVWVATVPVPGDVPVVAPAPTGTPVVVPVVEGVMPSDVVHAPFVRADEGAEPKVSRLPPTEPPLPEVSVDMVADIQRKGIWGQLRGENLWLAVGAVVVLAGALAAAGVYWNMRDWKPTPVRPVAVQKAEHAHGVAPAGVMLHHVDGAVEDANGTAVLAVTGQMTNTNAEAVALPRLRLELVAMDGTVRDAMPVALNAGIDPSPTLAPQATLPWAVSLTSPVMGSVRGWRVVFE